MSANEHDQSRRADPPGQPPVGIDLGTTYSVVAYLDSLGRPTSVPNGTGDVLTPSAVAFEEGTVIVGKEAVKGSVMLPRAFADCFKRDMGRHQFRRDVNGYEVPPEVLSAFLLERLKHDAQRRLGPIREVVITVPAFFDESRRKATQDAGRLAGLDVLDIINEPTAAALAYGYHRTLARGGGTVSSRERILVYDLGGGTFDVTVLEIQGDAFRTMATDGDVQLGGKDFDERMVNFLADRFAAAHGLDPRTDPQDAAQLWLDAQDVKHTLTERGKATVTMFHCGIRMRQEITRAEFEEMTRDLLERTQTTTSLVVKQAGLAWTDIDRVLLVGGASRMPMVADVLRQLTGHEPDRSQSPDEAVAHGAALYAGMLSAKSTTDRTANGMCNFELVNVNSHSLGVVGRDPATRQKVNVILIPRNTPLPYRKVKRFITAHANQTTVKVSIVEGESQRPEYCIALGDCIVRNLPPDLPKGSPVEVEYCYAANGRISVSARVPRARQSASVEIERTQSRQFSSLEEWRERLTAGERRSPSDPPPTGDVQPGRLESLKRLDDLYMRIGERAMTIPLPAALAKSQRSAAAAAGELQKLRVALQHAEGRQAKAGKGPNAVHAIAEAAQARLAVQQALSRSRFAFLVLGRECAEMDCGNDRTASANTAGLQPGLKIPGLEHELDDIRRLRSRP